jgi:GalNAc-alpha-(1->4)-GalNAc-alpha-(1->3)-diNAcBac-PP-undecaprenol alpha-1,4-N-acetyl-D-galactosaminyltransferase
VRVKILLLTSSMGSGGAERVASVLSAGWQAQGHQVTLMPTFSGRGDCFYELAPGVELTYLADRVKGRTRGPANQLARLLALRRHMAQSRPDVVVSFLSNVNVAAILAAAGLRVPVVVCERCDPFVTPMPGSLRLAARLLYPFARTLVVQTLAVAVKYRASGMRLPALEVIGNPVEPQLLALEPSARGTRRCLLAMGRLSPEKRFGLLIEAFSRLAPAHPDWDLKILGDGPLRQELLAQVARHGLQERVLLPGVVRDVTPELAGADAFALCSSYEGFPNALLEAMACGLACVAFDCPSGPRELSEEGRMALLVPSDDGEGLGRELDRLMSQPALRTELGRAARASVGARFAVPVVLDRWTALFRGLGFGC